MTTIFWCEDSLDGILTGIYDAWDSRLGHKNVRLKTDAADSLELFCEYRQVKTDALKAEKVLRTIRQKLGEEAFEAVCYAAACTDSKRADAIYRMVVLGLHMMNGHQVVNCLQDPDVSLVMRLRTKAWHEAHRYMGFVRFEELENGVLYSTIEPAYAVLPLLAPHFSDRFQQENWVIHDKKRSVMAVHPKGSLWVLADAKELNPDYLMCRSGQEKEFQELWKLFCKTIAIEERRNPRCQQGLLPLRFRSCMTEFRQERDELGGKQGEK
ncbi:MAG: DNA metabolism protein [Lachnospiraceae bacterium]|jgi:probable DNA metabolism protein|nr:DNA metabolism protein [Lachnospiraceae bacterium]